MALKLPTYVCRYRSVLDKTIPSCFPTPLYCDHPNSPCSAKFYVCIHAGIQIGNPFLPPINTKNASRSHLIVTSLSKIEEGNSSMLLVSTMQSAPMLSSRVANPLCKPAPKLHAMRILPWPSLCPFPTTSSQGSRETYSRPFRKFK